VEITEVRIKLMNDRDEKLQAFCSITFNDDFVVRDLKIIGGSKGSFVAMPSRKLMDRCTRCGGKNHLRAKFCNECGFKLDSNRSERDKRGRARLHTDIAHPINTRFRETIQERIIKAYQDELVKAEQPGYTAPSMDYDLFEEADNSPSSAGPRWPTPNREPRETQECSKPDQDKKKAADDSFDAGIFS